MDAVVAPPSSNLVGCKSSLDPARVDLLIFCSVTSKGFPPTLPFFARWVLSASLWQWERSAMRAYDRNGARPFLPLPSLCSQPLRQA